VRCTFTNRERAKLTVEKQTLPDGSAQLFDFTGSANLPDADEAFSLSDGNSHSVSDLAPGSYEVTETGEPGWDLTQLSCDDAGDDVPSTTDLAGGKASFELEAGEDVTCTFTNRERAKLTVPDGSAETFGFTTDLPDPDDSFSLADEGVQTASNLVPGAYQVDEDPKANWDLTQIGCTDPDDGTSTSLVNRRASIDLDPGETVHCTFTNHERAKLIVEKQTVPNGAPGNFTFTGTAAGTISDNGQIVVADLTPGTYTSIENDPAPSFLLSSIGCDDANSTGSLATRTATFRLEAGETVRCTFTNAKTAQISGKKYYDANTNGQRDAGEPGIAGWPIDYSGAASGTLTTGSGGSFSTILLPGNYTLAERVANSPWIQTGNLVDQTSASGGATANLSNKQYSLELIGSSSVSGLNFGNVCIGAGGGHTLGFWSNKNGQKLFGAGDLAAMVTLNLRNANGSHFNPTGYAQFQPWLLSATATNMAYMLSAQLAAMKLNVLNGFVNGNALIYAPGTNSANANGFAKVSDVIAEADAELSVNGNTTAAGPARIYQRNLKDALDNANNDLTFVKAGTAACPTPTFP
jgi:hypothetical protein